MKLPVYVSYAVDDISFINFSLGIMIGNGNFEASVARVKSLHS